MSIIYSRQCITRGKYTHAKTHSDSKPGDFDGIAVKRFLLGQARGQVSWYRQSIDALDYVGCVACRRALETGPPFLEHYLPAYNFRDTERGTEYQRDAAFPFLGDQSMVVICTLSTLSRPILS